MWEGRAERVRYRIGSARSPSSTAPADWRRTKLRAEHRPIRGSTATTCVCVVVGVVGQRCR
jgi:hypothetical protein